MSTKDNDRSCTIFISDDVKLGKDVKLFGFNNLYGCTVGDGTQIGTFVEIQKKAFIGKKCKISSHTFICETLWPELASHIMHL
jgi:UDP-3-O-[3-hydroxymyristoyl] glucosamine N-acyltransferase